MRAAEEMVAAKVMAAKAVEKKVAVVTGDRARYEPIFRSETCAHLGFLRAPLTHRRINARGLVPRPVGSHQAIGHLQL